MEQEITPKNRIWFSSIVISRVHDGLYPAALEFFRAQSKQSNVPGGIAWTLRYPLAHHIMFAAISCEKVVGLVFWQEAENAAVLILDKIYFGGGTFLRLLQAMDEYLKHTLDGYVLRMPDLQGFRSLALASGCLSIQGCGGVLSANRVIVRQNSKIILY